MRQILIVDDEPIILAGIKFLIDWEQCGCEIAGTARNGSEAIRQIELLCPDIVLCDINMPVMNGVELLEWAAQHSPGTVFVMLTNLEDFSLVQTALRLRATDYLLKSQLEAATLEKALEHAKRECEARTKLARVEMVDDYLKLNRVQVLRNAFSHIVQSLPGDKTGETAAVLAEHGVLAGYGALYVALDFSAIASFSSFDAQEAQRLLAWQTEVTDKLLRTFYPHALMLSQERQGNTLLILCWGMTAAQWDESLPRFAAHLATASANVTQARCSVLSTDFFEGTESLGLWRTQLFLLRDWYYLTASTTVRAADIPAFTCENLGLNGIAGKLATELRAKSVIGCNALLEKAQKRVEERTHQLSQALWLCSELYAATGDCLRDSKLPAVAHSGMFADSAQGRREIDRLSTRVDVLAWLRRLQAHISAMLEQCSPGKSELVEKARQYVLDNVEKRIMLQDVADVVCISPAYLSALFTKQYNQTFVDFINQCKIQRACQMIREGNLRIYEVALALSFENAYYFTKVFKRHVGMTPTEYQKSLHSGAAQGETNE